ncbi:hypothetical protein [Anatilimnocola floriformis]|uniref:hypothetical protein n=1 Tax=Anatilimnocola floriformis TaxID=2948575 RepID=UPI0020C434B2|nr:hypothetical protein [Anatilimnocola floriformis]
MSVIAGAARVYLRADLPDQPLDSTPPLPLRPIEVTPAKPVGLPADDRRPSNETYRVLSARGLTLGKFDQLPAASAALNAWSQAVAVVSSSAVIERKHR